MPLSLRLAALLALGSAAGLYNPTSASLFIVLAVCAAAGAALARLSRADGATVALLSLVLVSAAAWRAGTVARQAENPPLMPWLDAHASEHGAGENPRSRQPVHVRGRLAADAVASTGGAQLQIAVSAVQQDQAWLPVTGGLGVTVSGALFDGLSEWRAGRTVVAPVSLRRPTEYRNEGLADPRARAWRGAALAGSIKSGTLVEVVDHGQWWDERAAAVRAHVRGAVQRHVAALDRTSAAIATAILIGDRAALSPDVERGLQEAGTYHVIAISGGNIALLAGAVLAVLWCVGVRFAAAAGPTVLVLVAHAWVVGGGPSVVRATAVACIYLLLRIIDQRTAPVHALAVAAALMLVASPAEIASAGFWLTFGATTALVMVAARGAAIAQGRWWTPLITIAAASLAVEGLLLPISAYVFERVTLAGLVLNLVAVPAMAVVQASASLCALADASGLLTLAGWCGMATHLGARVLVGSSGLVAVAPWVTWRVPAPPFALVLIYYAQVALWWRASTPPVDTLARVRIRRWTAIAAGAMWIWIASAPGSLVPGQRAALRVTALDVGQGDAFLVKAPDGHTIMVDAGGVPGGFDIGDRVVGPGLRARGVRRIDYLAVTHPDLDHLGGAATLVREFTPREVWAGVPVGGHGPLHLLRDAATTTRTAWRWLQRGDRIELGGIEIRAHHPPLPDWERARVRNDDSLVLEVRYGAVSIWLTGDVTRPAELEMVAAPDPARVNVLKAPHHGSLTSSSPEWLARLRPVAVIVSAGRGNPFGHPAPAVLRRYESARAAVFRTDQDGQIDLVTNGTFVEISTFTGRKWRLR